MSDLLDNITAQLRHFTHEETIALVRDFLVGLDEKQQTRFLNLVAQDPRPLVAEAMGLDDADDLLDEIQSLRDAIAKGVYVEYGAGYDPEYGEYRGFGDDSWIDEMDDLFAAATSFFRAGQFKAAADAYIALFDIFDLNEDGFHFTRPDPAAALHTDVDAMKENLFIGIGRGFPGAASKAIEVSGDVYYYGHNRCALLDAWEGREELMAALEAALIVRACQPARQGPYGYSLSHPAELLREFYRRHRALPDYEVLCREVGPQQGWPYEDLVNRYQEQEDWERVLAWAEDGLEKLPGESRCRLLLQEARGQALLHLDRPTEALDELQALFQKRRWEAPVYLKLRQAAQATGRWEALYPQLTAEMQAHVLSTDWSRGYPVVVLTEACLLGYAYRSGQLAGRRSDSHYRHRPAAYGAGCPRRAGRRDAGAGVARRAQAHPRARQTPGSGSAYLTCRPIAGQRRATVRAVGRTGHRRPGSLPLCGGRRVLQSDPGHPSAR
jgi:tetratricopeptide (TPR) repeat protein